MCATQMLTYLLSSTGLCNSQTDTEDGISAKVTLVWSSIKLDQELINLWLILNINVLFDESRADDFIDVGNGLGNTFPAPFCFISIAKLDCLVLACIERSLVSHSTMLFSREK
jgi:hypothetical protein